MNNEKIQESTIAKITGRFSAMDVSLLYDLIIKYIIANIAKGKNYLHLILTLPFVLVSIKLYNENIYFCNGIVFYLISR